MKARYFTFEPFRLDALDERLWKGDANVPLGRKAFGVLARLVSHPNQLVTKDDLLASVWAETAVSESVLTTAMREIREAVGDTARTPRFIATVYGRGYRFIAPVVETSGHLRARSVSGDVDGNHDRVSAPSPDMIGGGIVGREPEWARLCEWFADVQRGTRRIGFIVGEAGIGKTALVDAFVTRLVDTTTVRIARGQCIDQYGAGEAYLPVLEAIGRLGREVETGLVRVLQDHAPSWLPHLPSLAPGSSELGTPVRPERMLRELADAIEVFTAAEPLVLILEDLHWSDGATLQWLSYVARRCDPARLLVLGTYRPVEALVHENPLRRVLTELRGHAQVTEMVLDYLPREAVHAYLQQRCGNTPAIEAHAAVLHRRTGGHPLFLACIVDELVHAAAAPRASVGAIDLTSTARALPMNVRLFIDHRFESLTTDDRSILEAASVAGESFPVAAVVAGTTLGEEVIEGRCATLADTYRILLADGIVAWPDGPARHATAFATRCCTRRRTRERLPNAGPGCTRWLVFASKLPTANTRPPSPPSSPCTSSRAAT
jgi:DNA-binding winged helix-turn-helix (wHTH) protein